MIIPFLSRPFLFTNYGQTLFYFSLPFLLFSLEVFLIFILVEIFYYMAALTILKMFSLRKKI